MLSECELCARRTQRSDWRRTINVGIGTTKRPAKIPTMFLSSMMIGWRRILPRRKGDFTGQSRPGLAWLPADHQLNVQYALVLCMSPRPVGPISAVQQQFTCCTCLEDTTEMGEIEPPAMPPADTPSPAGGWLPDRSTDRKTDSQTELATNDPNRDRPTGKPSLFAGY